MKNWMGVFGKRKFKKLLFGGGDEEGRKDPAKLIFIYKTGFQSHMDGANFKPPRKNSKSAKQAAGLCSHPTDKVETTCSHHSDDTYRDGHFDVKSEPATT